MTQDRGEAYAALIAFLDTIAKNKPLLASALEAAQPVFELTRSPEYNLRPWQELDADGVASVIRRAIDPDVRDVTFVPVNEPFPPPSWMVSDRETKSLVSQLLDASIGEDNTLSSVLHDRFRDRIKTALGDDNSRELWGLVWKCLFDTRWYAPDTLRGVPGTCLFTFFGLVAAGDVDAATDFRSLIKLLPKVRPIGRKKDDPGLWLVLTA